MDMYGDPYAGRVEYPASDPREMLMRRAAMNPAMQRTAMMDLDAFLAGLSVDDALPWSMPSRLPRPTPRLCKALLHFCCWASRGGPI